MFARVLRQTGGGTVARNTTPITSTTRNLSSGHSDPGQSSYGASQSGQSASGVEHGHPVDEGQGAGQPPSTEGAAKDKPQPKIHPNSTPGGQGDKDVERHNQEMAERYDKRMARGGEGGDDKAGKGYWKGMSFIFLLSSPFFLARGLTDRPRTRWAGSRSMISISPACAGAVDGLGWWGCMCCSICISCLHLAPDRS